MAPVMPAWLEALEAALPGRVVTDAEILEAHRHDHAGLAEGIGDWLERVHTEEGGGRRALVLRVR